MGRKERIIRLSRQNNNNDLNYKNVATGKSPPKNLNICRPFAIFARQIHRSTVQTLRRDFAILANSQRLSFMLKSELESVVNRGHGS